MTSKIIDFSKAKEKILNKDNLIEEAMLSVYMNMLS